jgi:hypothetical protein
MTTGNDYRLIGLSVLGFVVMVGSLAVRPWELALPITIGGSIVCYGSIGVIYFVQKGEIRVGDERYDERLKLIEGKAFRNAWGILMAVTSTLLIMSSYVPWSVSSTAILLGLLGIGLFTFFVSMRTYKTRM